MVASPFEFETQLLKVIDLAVKDDPNCFVSIRHRLMSARQVDDGKPSKTQSNRTFGKVTFVVRSAMNHCLRHAPDDFRFYRFRSGKIKLAANTAHLGS